MGWEPNVKFKELVEIMVMADFNNEKNTHNDKYIEGRKVKFIFCSFYPVGLNDYVEYLRNNFNEFTYLKWRFPHSKDKKNFSSIYIYKQKRLIKKKKLFSFSFANYKPLYFSFLPLNYLIYFSQAMVQLARRDKKKKMVFMGINYFCTFCGIILKKLGKVDFVIYRVMDFFPLPPSGIYRYLNRIFYLFDKFCLNNSDSIWFTTEGHIIGREKYGYFDRKGCSYKLTPLGININKFISIPTNEKSRYSIVYCGIVSRYHMLDLIFDVVYDLKKEFSQIRLNVLGTGPDDEYFRKLAQKMNLEENIIFHGPVEEGEKFTQLMANNILGIALYRDEENFMRYTEPAKVKYYLSFGIPAIVSRVPIIAKELHDLKVCFAVNNKKDEIVKIIGNYILDERMQNEYRDNIRNFIKIIDINTLLENTFKGIFSEFEKYCEDYLLQKN